jgi:pseudouridine-5'-phosphate glycosidase/pseudouridine kinase
MISQSLGGVAHNIARTAHLIGSNAKLCSIVADDLAGRTALRQLAAEEMHADGIRTVTGERTAQYIAVNDLKKDLIVAMADMGILERQSNIFTSDLKGQLETEKPKWLVADGNLPSDTMLEIFRFAKRLGTRTAFDPVSTSKSARLFITQNTSILPEDDAHGSLPVFPNHVVDMATPNHLELAAMHTTAREAGHFDSSEWWKVIDSLGIPSSGARSRFLSATSSELVDQGVPQQCVQLLPFIPMLLTKLGAKGVLLTMLLGQDDERLRDGRTSPYVISRSRGEDPGSPIGGVYMKLFPPVELLADSEVVSVNGVGDTFLGAMIGAEVQTGKDIDELVDFAQRAAIQTLRSREAVCPSLKKLKGQLCS